VLSGVPAANGVYPITITASNGVGSAATQSFTLTVNQAPAFTSANSAAFMVGTAGSFTVAAAGFPAPGIAESGALPSGVGFVDNGNGTGTLSGIAIASGTFNIGFTASNSAGNATQNFTLAVSAKTPTVTALTSSANPSTTGQSVTFSVVVSSGAAGTPTGTVTFMDDTTTLGTSTLDATGTATFATSGLAAGTHSITAAYGGDAVFAASSSAILSQMVTGPADFTLSTQPGSATIQAGQTATFTITASAQNGFSSAITLACTSGAPTLSTCQFSSNPITPVASPATSTLTIMTTAAVAANTGPEQRRHSLPLYALWLMVPAMLLGSAKFGSQHRKKLFSFVIVLMILGGCMFQGACLSARNIGGGNASPGTPAGTYTITVTGTAGATQNVVALTLTVQ
jgi:Bacterial Ig-like domain (group 3)/Putative Ig domain